jgi:hypothetical protein
MKNDLAVGLLPHSLPGKKKSSYNKQPKIDGRRWTTSYELFLRG